MTKTRDFLFDLRDRYLGEAMVMVRKPVGARTAHIQVCDRSL